MQIHRIRLVNFRSFLDREFFFSGGLNLLVGPNGAGKSSILEGIGIVLFNAPKTSLKDAIARGKDYASIYLEFDGYKVRRSFGSLIEYVLETPEGKYEGKDTVLAKLSQLLEVPNLESFWSDVVTIKQFQKLRPFDATPNERLLLFGRILGIERYEAEFNYLKDVLGYGKKLIDEQTAHLKRVEERNEQTRLKNEQVANEKANLPVIEGLLKEATGKLEEARIKQTRLAEQVANVEKKRHLRGYLAQLETKAMVPAGSKLAYQRDLEIYVDRKDDYFTARSEYTLRKETLTKRLTALRQAGSLCPVCRQTLSGSNRDAMISEIRAELMTLREPAFLMKEPARPGRWLEDGLELEIERVKQEMASIPDEPVEIVDITDLALNVAQLEQGLKTIENLKETPLEETDSALLRLYQEAYDRIELYRKNIKNKISTIPVQAREVISQRANSLYQSFMAGHHDVSLTLDSSYGVVATIRGQEVPFASLGGAESVTAALAVRLAIAHYLAKDLDLLFLDEATDALDKQAQEQMVRIVEDLPGQVFVITHENVFTKGNVIEV